MQKNIIIIIICIVLFAIIGNVKNLSSTPKAKHNTYLEKTFKKEWLKNVDFSVLYLSPETVSYLKTHSELKDEYTQGKKIIVYPPDAGSCPYGQAFLNYLEETKNEPKNSEKYIFHPRQYRGFSTIDGVKSYDEIEQLKKEGFNFDSDLIYLTKSDAKLEEGFNDTCSIVCIVNTKNNQLISFDGAGPSLGVKMQGILDQLKDW